MKTIFVVDDAEQGRLLVKGLLGKEYQVEVFASAAACIDQLGSRKPDLFLLDVHMPDINGYELCQYIRNIQALRYVPVIFLSADEELGSMLSGYDAGGDDFVCKPFNVQLLRRKIESLLSVRADRGSLIQQIQDDETLTTLIMSNLDEYAVLVKFLRSLNTCDSMKDIADQALSMIQAYHLDGVIQFRLEGFELTLNSKGEVRPLESSIINQVRSMGSIAEYHARAAFNYDRVSILINNMPRHDPDLCGRLRDHLAIATETVDAKIASIETRSKRDEAVSNIVKLVAEVSGAVDKIKSDYAEAKKQSEMKARSLTLHLEEEFAGLGMKEVQEEAINELVEGTLDHLMKTMDFSSVTLATLNKVADTLHSTLEVVV